MTVADQFAVGQSIFRGFCLKLLLIGLSYVWHSRDNMLMYCYVVSQVSWLTAIASLYNRSNNYLLWTRCACLPRAQLCHNM